MLFYVCNDINSLKLLQTILNVKGGVLHYKPLYLICLDNYYNILKGE